MNGPFVLAALLATGVGVAHSWLGERFVLRRLFRRELPTLRFGGRDQMRTTLRFAWHLTSIAWLGAAGVLVVLAGRTLDGAGAAVALTLAATFLLSALVSGIASRGRHLSWIVFLAISLAVWIGAR